jgi:superfamily II DNA or RNA helicase
VLLPEYALVYGEGNDLAKRAAALKITLMNRHSNSKEEHEKIYEEFRNGSIRRVIATGVYKQAVDFPLLSVLVRADGSPSPILSSQIPGRLSRLSRGKGRGVLVDFRDLFNSTAKGHYHARLKNYRKNGWSIDHRGDILSEEG